MKNTLGMILIESQNPTEGVTMLEEALAAFQEVSSERDRPTSACMSNLANALMVTGNNARALELGRAVYETRRAVLGATHPSTFQALHNLSSYLGTARRFSEAIASETEVITGYQKIFGDDHSLTLLARGQLAEMLVETGDLERAETIARDVTAGFGRIEPAGHPHVIRSKSYLGTILAKRKKPDEAETLLKDALALAQRYQPESRIFNDAIERLARFYLETGVPVERARAEIDRTLGSA